MKLEQKLSTSCPVCGCNIVVCEGTETNGTVIRRHTNGQRWDYRIFLCGMMLKWIPNFSCEEVKQHCSFDSVYVAKQKQMRELDEQISELQQQKRDLL